MHKSSSIWSVLKKTVLAPFALMDQEALETAIQGSWRQAQWTSCKHPVSLGETLMLQWITTIHYTHNTYIFGERERERSFNLWLWLGSSVTVEGSLTEALPCVCDIGTVCKPTKFQGLLLSHHCPSVRSLNLEGTTSITAKVVASGLLRMGASSLAPSTRG